MVCAGTWGVLCASMVLWSVMCLTMLTNLLIEDENRASSCDLVGSSF